MDATSLKTGDGTDLVCDGRMREAISYDIEWDVKFVRWDTVIDGMQAWYGCELLNNLGNARQAALKYFEGLEHG